MELQQYLGDKLSKKIIEEATLETKEFASETPGTQLKVCIQNAHELNLLKKSVPHFLNFANEMAVENENLEKTVEILEEENEDYKKRFNYFNPTYVERRAAISQVITAKKNYR